MRNLEGLSKFDIEAISKEDCLRKLEIHATTRKFDYKLTTKENDYLQFLIKCHNHAIIVGDETIARGIKSELKQWREV